jgi:hypothetical protein
MVQAVAYTRKIILAQPGEVIDCAAQTERVKQFADENAMEIIAWFTDESEEGNLLKRPGIQALLNYDRTYKAVICERVWVLSRSTAALEPFFKELNRRGAGFESAVSMWDCVSQQCRRHSRSLPVLPRVIQLPDEAGGLVRYRVAKPVRLNFVNLVHQAPSSISPRL